MKVALFTDSYLPNTDGVVSSILAYRKGMEAKGHEMLIFAPDAPFAKPEKGTYRFKSIVFPPYPDYRLPLFPSIRQEMLLDGKVKIIHSKAMASMGLAARSLANKTRIPSLASLETMVPEGTHYVIPIESGTIKRFGRSIGWSYLRWFYSGFDMVSAPSRHTQNMMAENGIESVVLPSPIDTGRFKPNKKGKCVKRMLGLAGKKIIASVGRVVKEKNYDFIMDTAEKTRDRDAVFLIVGKGPYLSGLKEKAAKLGLEKRIVFAGFVPDSHLVDYYNAADCFLFPSRFETQGLAALEALSCGKPVCAMDGTPMSELVKNGKNGYLIPDDAPMCARVLEKCLAESRRMARHARESAIPYSIPNCTERLLSLYGRLLE